MHPTGAYFSDYHLQIIQPKMSRLFVLCGLLFSFCFNGFLLATEVKSPELEFVRFSLVPDQAMSPFQYRDSGGLAGKLDPKIQVLSGSDGQCPAESECAFPSKCESSRRNKPISRCEVRVTQAGTSMKLPGGVCCRKIRTMPVLSTAINAAAFPNLPVSARYNMDESKSGHMVNFVIPPKSLPGYDPAGKQPLILRAPMQNTMSFIPGRAPVEERAQVFVPQILRKPPSKADEPEIRPTEPTTTVTTLDVTQSVPQVEEFEPKSLPLPQSEPVPQLPTDQQQVPIESQNVPQQFPPPVPPYQPSLPVQDNIYSQHQTVDQGFIQNQQQPPQQFVLPQSQFVQPVQQQFIQPQQQLPTNQFGQQVPINPQPGYSQVYAQPMQQPPIPMQANQQMQQVVYINGVPYISAAPQNQIQPAPGIQNYPVYPQQPYPMQNSSLYPPQQFNGYPSASQQAPQPVQQVIPQQLPNLPTLPQQILLQNNPPPSTFCGVPDPIFAAGVGRSPRILGGRPTRFGAWPWMAVIENSRRMVRCGATLLNEQFLITAAHCVYKNYQYGYYGDLRVNIGVYNLDDRDNDFTPAVREEIAYAYPHPYFNMSESGYDVALIQLKRPIKFRPNILPVCLPSSEHLGQTGTVLGWGKRKETDDRMNLPTVLQEVELPILHPWQCLLQLRSNGIFEDVGPQFLCAGGKANKDACRGDSGGPLLASKDGEYWEIVGIVSKGYGCGRENVPGIYTNLYHLRSWIEDTVARNWNAVTGPNRGLDQASWP